MDTLANRHKRIFPAVLIYSKENKRRMDEQLFIDMLKDLLSLARDMKSDTKEIMAKADTE